MDLSGLKKQSDFEWHILPFGQMRVPAIIYAGKDQLLEMDQKVYEQITNVATLPGIVKAAYAMPDAHWGYGFPIGGVAAFDPEQGGVISAGGVGFDISCGVRTMLTGLHADEVFAVQKKLADLLYHNIPAGVGSTGLLHLNLKEMDKMLSGGAQWAVAQGYGTKSDLERIEEHGRMAEAKPEYVSARAKKRQEDEVGTLGSGNHYLEIQVIEEIYNPGSATVFGLNQGEVVVSLHCGSRGLGHQIGTEFLKLMVTSAPKYGIHLPDRELACAPLDSPVGVQYLGAMRAAINCALANRQVIMHLIRDVFAEIFPNTSLPLLYDVSHNTCKMEKHQIEGKEKNVYVHRKGATRAFGPGHPNLPPAFRNIGQPVLIGGSMGTASYILTGTKDGLQKAFGSACHGAGRCMSRKKATKHWRGSQVIGELEEKGILIRSRSMRGIAEEAPGAYKDIDTVIEAAEKAGLTSKVAKVKPIICIKG
ncbi:MAG: RtcB family protein [Desulfobacterales bacterium]|nr:RtcB family protein [Desulfobacterales bacterium]